MNQHRVLIVGVGSIGERHTRCFIKTGRAVVGIVEPAPDLRSRVASQYGAVGAYASLGEALAADTWNSAVICTPASTHVSLAIQCLDASISTLIEKPLAIATADACKLLRYQGMGLQIGVAYVYRAHPALHAAREAVCSGRFGKPLQVVATQGQHFPTFRPAYASTYYRQHATGGGAIQDALTHTFNAVEWIVGPVTRITVDADHLVLPDVQVEDTVHAIARHGRVMASYALNQHQPPNETTITIVCERGTVRFEAHHSRWSWQVDPRGAWTLCPVDVACRDTGFELQAHAWLDAVEGKAAPLCTLQEGLQTLAVNEAALESVRRGGTAREITSAASVVTEQIDVGA